MVIFYDFSRDRQRETWWLIDECGKSNAMNHPPGEWFIDLNTLLNMAIEIFDNRDFM